MTKKAVQITLKEHGWSEEDLRRLAIFLALPESKELVRRMTLVPVVTGQSIYALAKALGDRNVTRAAGKLMQNGGFQSLEDVSRLSRSELLSISGLRGEASFLAVNKLLKYYGLQPIPADDAK